jgi:hypothetical protein
MKPTSRRNLLDIINAERAELKPMREEELSRAVDAINRNEHHKAARRFEGLLPAASMTLPGPEPFTTALHIVEVRRALAFREVVQLDQRIEAERTGTPLPWQRRKSNREDGPDAA